MNPRTYGVYFELYAGTSGFFLQIINDRGQPLAMFNSLDRSIDIVGDCDIPNHYTMNELDNLIANINLSNYYNKADI